MARKKTKHINISEEALERARREAAGEIIVPANRPTEAPRQKKDGSIQSQEPARVTHEDLLVDYAYVIADLRNMGILAAILFIVLIALSFIM